MAVTISQLQKWLEEYQERMARMLGLKSSELQPVSITQGDAGGHWAVGGNWQIEVSKELLKDATEGQARATIIHEGVHAITDTTGSDSKGQEALADAIRYQMVGTMGGWQPGKEAMRFVDLAPWQMRAVVGTMQNGTFNSKVMKGLESGNITREDVQGKSETGAYSPQAWHAAQGSAGTEVSDTTDGGWTPPEIDSTGDGTTLTPEQKAIRAERQEIRQERRKRERSEDKANTIASWTETLRTWGINVSPEIQALMSEGFLNEWSDDMFIASIRGTQDYRERFKFIPDDMSETTYIDYEHQFRAAASSNGIHLGENRMHYLFKNEQTPEEFADRAVAFKRLQRSPDLYKAYAKELVQGGLAKPGEVDKKGLFKAVMGEQPQAWYDLWQDAVTRNAAVEAGISFQKGAGKYTSLHQGVLERISGMDLSEEEMVSKFTEVSDMLENVLPMAEAGQYGVNKKTLVKGTFGGKGAASARRKIKQAMDTGAAFDENRATNATYQDNTGRTIVQGVSDPRRQQDSEL